MVGKKVAQVDKVGRKAGARRSVARVARAVVLGLAVSVSILALAACSSLLGGLAKNLAERSLEKVGLKVETTQDNVDLGKLPRELIYPGAKAKKSFSLEVAKKVVLSAFVFETESDFDQVKKFYSSVPGWKVSSQAETEEGGKRAFNITLTRPDGRVISNVMVSKEGAVTEVVVALIERR